MTETVYSQLIFWMIHEYVSYIIKEICRTTLSMNIKGFLAEPVQADAKNIEKKSY